MKVIRCKLQSQTVQPINERQKDYYFACPIRNIAVGNTVLVEYSVRSAQGRKSTYMTVGRVEEIYEGKPWEMMDQFHPTATAVCMLEEKMQDYDAFWKRLDGAKKRSASFKRDYAQEEHKEAVKRKTKRRLQYEAHLAKIAAAKEAAKKNKGKKKPKKRKGAGAGRKKIAADKKAAVTASAENKPQKAPEAPKREEVIHNEDSRVS